MKLNRRDEGAVTVLGLSGKLMGGPDSAIFKDSIQGLIDEGRNQIVADLEKLSWVNSTGLGILLAGFRIVNEAEGQLKMARVASRIQSILMITKLTTVFETYSTVEEAIESFKAKQDG